MTSDLVEKDQCSLKSIVHLLVRRVSDAAAANLLASQLQVAVPELVAGARETSYLPPPTLPPSLPSPSRQLLQRALVQKVEHCARRSLLVLQVAQPALDLVRVPQDLLLEREVTLLLRGRGRGREGVMVQRGARQALRKSNLSQPPLLAWRPLLH